MSALFGRKLFGRGNGFRLGWLISGDRTRDDEEKRSQFERHDLASIQRHETTFRAKGRAADSPWRGRAAISVILNIYCAAIDRLGQGMDPACRSGGRHGRQAPRSDEVPDHPAIIVDLDGSTVGR